MIYKRILPFILSFFFLAVSVFSAASGDKSGDHIAPDTAAQDDIYEPPKPDIEIRGVWVTYMTLDVENESDKEAAFKDKIDRVIEDMERAGLNTMAIQVRPFCDALYPSRYFPWSHILTGTQGEDPGYDPLEYIVETAHDHDIMVHAWLNPYRVSTGNTPLQLSTDNPYVKDEEICAEVNGSLYLDPASDKAIELIANGAKEIAENYEIDGIQFDDYFYPPDCGDFDAEEYEAYCESADSPLSLTEFRKDNVNRMIAAVYSEIHRVDKDILFGVSPQGNMGNNEELYADVRSWCAEKGYIDYICPQIYFSPDNPAKTFEEALRDWLETEKHDGLSVYIGIPAYKAGTDADSGTWLDNNDILKTEISIVREKGLDGFMLYSYDSFHNEENAEEIQNVISYLTTSPTQ